MGDLTVRVFAEENVQVLASVSEYKLTAESRPVVTIAAGVWHQFESVHGCGLYEVSHAAGAATILDPEDIERRTQGGVRRP